MDGALTTLDLCSLIDVGVYDRRKARLHEGACATSCEMLCVRDEPRESAPLENDGSIVDLPVLTEAQVEGRRSAQLVR